MSVGPVGTITPEVPAAVHVADSSFGPPLLPPIERSFARETAQPAAPPAAQPPSPPAPPGHVAVPPTLPPAPLTEAERRLLYWLSTGRTNTQIAECLVRSDKTVRNRLSLLYGKLRVANRTEAVAVYLRCGLGE